MIKVKVKNFGAIEDGEFEIKPLTIFMGDNNSGKSSIAKLIYSIIIHIAINKSFTTSIDDYKNTDSFKKINNFINNIKKDNQSSKYITNFNYDDKTSKLFFTNFNKGIKEMIKKIIEVYFENIKNSDVILNIDFNFFAIGINIKNSNIDIKIDNRLSKFFIIDKIIVEFVSDNNIGIYSGYSSTRVIDDNKIILKIYATNAEFHGLYSNILDFINQTYKEQILSFSNIDYFPASKTGLVSNYNKILGNVFHYLYISGINTKRILKKDNYFNQDFINTLDILKNEFIGEEKKERLILFDYLKKQFEGRIIVDSDKKLFYQLDYNNKKLNIPIDETSSKISELTPIYLYLKKLIKDNTENNLLILEEPEAHLNPKMQRIMARLLVMMANEGITLIITTHSDYILDEINILLKLKHIQQIDENRFNNFIKNDDEYEELMALDRENINVYRFIKDNPLTTIIEKVKVTKNKIDEKEFIETTENLYKKNCEVIELLKDL